ncbi:MAG: hypothetical protein O8C64_09625 [Candidatus Methanoperedens sp.]|nr:hypothetical protein [Candidatus Methanoperedens sp.]MCZ7404866.1 hypothetical protein [Candidatus Methanoperedens sp.]
MTWKSISKYLIVLCIGFVVGLFVGWNPTSEGTRGIVINGWSIILAFILGSFGGSDILNFISNYIKEKKDEKIRQQEKLEQKETERRDKKEKILLEHSMKAVNANLIVQAESSIELSNEKCGLLIQVNPKSTTSEYKRYNEDVNDHLKYGYEEAWNALKQRDSLIGKHNTEAEQFLKGLNLKIITELQKITKEQITYYPEQLYQIGCGIEWFYNHPVDKNKLSNELATLNNDDLWHLYKNQYLATSHNKTVIRNLKEKIISILIDALESDQFALLSKCLVDANENHKLFLKEINKIVILVHAGIPLKYECEIEKEVVEYGT